MCSRKSGSIFQLRFCWVRQAGNEMSYHSSQLLKKEHNYNQPFVFYSDLSCCAMFSMQLWRDATRTRSLKDSCVRKITYGSTSPIRYVQICLLKEYHFNEFSFIINRPRFWKFLDSISFCEPLRGYWPAVFFKTMFFGCSFLQAQKNWFSLFVIEGFPDFWCNLRRQ